MKKYLYTVKSYKYGSFKDVRGEDTFESIITGYDAEILSFEESIKIIEDIKQDSDFYKDRLKEVGYVEFHEDCNGTFTEYKFTEI